MPLLEFPQKSPRKDAPLRLASSFFTGLKTVKSRKCRHIMVDI